MPTASRRAFPALVSSLLLPGLFLQSPLSTDQNSPVPPSQEREVATDQAADSDEPPVRPGVVIEAIPKGSALEKAGLRAGDVILGWRRQGSDNEEELVPLSSPLDFAKARVEELPLEDFELVLARSSESIAVQPPIDGWAVEVRPNFNGPLLDVYRAGNSEDQPPRKGSKPTSQADLSTLLERLPARHRAELDAWVGLREAKRALGEGATQVGSSAIERALRRVEGHPVEVYVRLEASEILRDATQLGSAVALLSQDECNRDESSGPRLRCARLLYMLGLYLRESGRLSDAREVLLRARRLQEDLIPTSFDIAMTSNLLGTVANYLGELDVAKDLYEEALGLLARAAPSARELTLIRNNLATIALQQGECATALTESRAVLDDFTALEPRSKACISALSNLAHAERDCGSRDVARRLLLDALDIALYLADELEQAEVLSDLGVLERQAGKPQASKSYLQQALGIRQRLSPESRSTAVDMVNLANATADQGLLKEAKSLYLSALELLKSVDHSERMLASALASLGLVCWQEGDLRQALRFTIESFEIRQRVAPGSILEATSKNQLALLKWETGDLREAEKLALEALRVAERTAPGGKQAGLALHNLGLVQLDRGDLLPAEESFSKALAIFQEVSPTGKEMGGVVDNLGSVHLLLGNFELAKAYFHRVIELGGDRLATGVPAAAAWNSLGQIALEAGDLQEAEHCMRIAWSLRQDLSATSSDRSLSLRDLGRVLVEKGDHEEGPALVKQALTNLRAATPTSVLVPETLIELGMIELDRGKVREAEAHLDEAVEILAAMAPGSWMEIQALHYSAVVARRSGRRSEAARYSERALETLTRQGERVAPSRRASERFRSLYQEVFREAILNSLQAGEMERALEINERFRGATLRRELLNLRGQTVPDGSGESELRFATIDGRMERALEVASRCEQAESCLDEKEVFSYLTELQLERMRALAKETVPREAEDWIATGTCKVGITEDLVLSFVSHQETLLIVGCQAGKTVAVGQLDVGRRSLSERVRRAVELIREGAGKGAASRARRLSAERATGELYDLLLRPLEEVISSASRILILADGPLHYLPWSSLIRKYHEGSETKQQFLAEWKPFHVALSGTVFAELRKQRRPRPEGGAQEEGPVVPELVAFGDPVFPGEQIEEVPEKVADIRVRAAARRGEFEWSRLPWSRREVEGIAALFPPDRVKVFVGGEATEEHAKGVAKGARILHFATHAHVDDRFPLNSALVLTMPEGLPRDRDNGLFQAWEIFERLRLDADLVVLSGCQTALGEEQGGEGLVGLTRAFQHAGARSVLASLWSVQDQATSELMIRFYKHLRTGLTKDEALRQAQVELIRGPIEVVDEKGEKVLFDASSPYYWAGFQLYGDWQ